MNERFALPGFQMPGSPKADERVFSRPDGSIRLVLKDNVPLDEPTPDYRIHISTEVGTIVDIQATVRNGNVVQLRNEQNGTKRFILRLGPPCIQFLPATYTVRAYVDGCQVYFKNLTVSPDPALTDLQPQGLDQDQGLGGIV